MAQDLTKKQREGDGNVAERIRNTTTYTPRFDIVETDSELLLFGDLPGATKENLAVDFENGELVIEGKVEPRHADREFLYGEYGIGDFYRSFAISEDIDAEKISAQLNNGVLTLHLPKSEAVKPRRIEVKAGD